MKIIKTVVFPFLFSAVAFFASNAQSGDRISLTAVKTENGLVSGIPGTDKSVMVFKGIPYAAPPVGDLRWKEPQPVKNWKGIRKCASFGPNAMQAKPVQFQVWTKEFLIPATDPVSEDCLYLNIWTSATAGKEKRPVIVFIHGGGFVNGSGSVPIYNGEAMAKKGVVFVTINYRLGIFGFYANPALTKESPHHASGNYGIMDQVAALKWVQKNIAAFGGDPDKVTIAGQSAGSMSVNILDATPLAKGLFAKAIAESGAGVLPGMLRVSFPLDSAEAKGVQFEHAAGASSLEALRNMPVEKLMSIAYGGGTAIVDGYVLPASVATIFARHQQTDVPLLTGFNGDDLVFSAARTMGNYKEYVRNNFGEDADKILQYYPADTNNKGAKNLLRDMAFGMQNFAWAQMVSERDSSKSYLYFFNRKVPTYKDSTDYGAFHTGEVSYAYDNLQYINRPLVQADYELAKLMSSYWANFAKTGNPNGEGLPYWAAFDKEAGQTMIFDAAPALVKHPYFDALEFLYQRAAKQ
ncbi:MAG TPA: carboxylesterase family protein [Chitinophagaceae bacterium]|nr:carboxylesterase family protein [Chitinophagaceae bacterium]